MYLSKAPICYLANILMRLQEKIVKLLLKKEMGVVCLFFLPISSSFLSWTLAKKSFSTLSTSSWQWQAAYFSKRLLFNSINVLPHLNFCRRMVARSGNPKPENKWPLIQCEISISSQIPRCSTYPTYHNSEMLAVIFSVFGDLDFCLKDLKYFHISVELEPSKWTQEGFTGF